MTTVDRDGEIVVTAGVLDELDLAECLGLLGATRVGRIAVVVDSYPVVVPVNFRVVERSHGGPVIVVRVRPGGVVDLAGCRVSLQIDGVDQAAGAGWSVLVRGNMHPVEASSLVDVPWVDPDPLLPGRDRWLVIAPEAITGRRVLAAELAWGFHPLGYL